MSLYDPILTSIGLLEDGKLSQTAIDRFWDDVTALLTNGNDGGHGIPGPLTKILPIPPIDPLPPIINVTTAQPEKVFWFGPDPLAAQTVPYIRVRKNAELLHQIFIDTLYEKTAQVLDLKGQTPLAPVFDVSAAFPDVHLPIPFTPPDLIAALKITPPQLPSVLLKAGIKIPPDPPKVPSIPLALPPLPKEALQLPVPPLVLPDLLLGLMQLPFKTLLKLFVPPDINLVANLPALPSKVFGIAFQLMVDLLKQLNLLVIVPKTLIAALLVYLKNVVGMVITVLIGSIVGTGGLARSGAQLCGLV